MMSGVYLLKFVNQADAVVRVYISNECVELVLCRWQEALQRRPRH